MKKIFLIIISIILGCFVSMHFFYRPSYRDKAAQMIMVGFDGLILTPDNPIYRDIKDNHIGGVILFNQKGDILNR